MKKDYAHLGIIVDRSRSMAGPGWVEMENGVREFINKNRGFGEATVSLHVFDSVLDRVLFFKNIKDIDKDANLLADYKPRDSTALYDATCNVVDEIGVELSTMKEENRPDQVIILVVTDGGENASKKFKANDVRSRIETQKNQFGWQFVFLGADFSVDTYASQLSVGKNLSRNVSKTDLAFELAQLGNYTSNYRSSKSALALEAEVSSIGN